MPITIHIAQHPANKYVAPVPSPTSPQSLLNGLGREYACTEGGVIQESVPETDLDYLTPHRNGFMRSILDAYAGHHHLVLRPDDVWIAILSQLKYFIQSHPDAARLHFLPDQPDNASKLPLPVSFIGSAETVNVAIIANQMTRDLQTQIADASFREFILPTFSTTSIEDKIICTILMLSTMDSLFDVSLSLMCGIPSLTLLGVESDWSSMLTRVQTIADGKYGNEARHWGSTLLVILTKCVAAFQNAPGGSTEWRGGDDKDFWQSIVKFSRSAGDDGKGLIGGWATAFARWGPSPPSLGAGKTAPSAEKIEQLRAEPLSEAAQYDTQPPMNDSSFSGTSTPLSPAPSASSPNYIYKSLKFPTLHPSRIPSAIAVLSFPLSDNGKEQPVRLIAGHIGKTWFGMNEDTVQPCPVWMLYVPGVNAETPAAAAAPEPVGSSTSEKVRRAVTVMMRSRKKSTPTPAASSGGSVAQEPAVPPPMPTPATFPVRSAAVAASEEEKNRWKRLVQHTRKLSERGGSPADARNND